MIDQLGPQAMKTQSENKILLLKLRQGLAIHGHKKEDGNLIQDGITDEDFPDLKRWLGDQQNEHNNGKYTSS